MRTSMGSGADETVGDAISELLDGHGAGAFGPGVSRFYDRDRAHAIIRAALWGYGVRADSTAGAYAGMALFEALGLKAWTFDEDEADLLRRHRAGCAAAPPPERVRGWAGLRRLWARMRGGSR